MKLKYSAELVQDIKDKKELRTLDEDFIIQKLDVFFVDKSHELNKKRFLDKLEKSKTYKQFTKSKEYKFLIKEIRAELRRVYGVFILEGYNKRESLLKELEEDASSEGRTEICTKLLNLHKSTKERMDHYEELYTTIFDTIGRLSDDKTDKNATDKKMTFMDLACGMNPISSIFFREKIKKYYASDISTEDCEFLKRYFDTTDIDAVLFPLDLVDERNFPKLSKIKVDMCFIFKTLDGLERVKRDITERLLQSISTGYFAITFPTLSIGGKREIKEHRRLWLERLLERLKWRYEKFTLGSELLYIVKKG